MQVLFPEYYQAEQPLVVWTKTLLGVDSKHTLHSALWLSAGISSAGIISTALSG